MINGKKPFTVFPTAPNALYRAIKSRSWLSLVLWSPVVVILLPFALAEMLLSADASRGATIVHYLRKPGAGTP